jgi:hypothetical protein
MEVGTFQKVEKKFAVLIHGQSYQTIAEWR